MRELPGDFARSCLVIRSPYATAAPAHTSATTTPYSLKKLVKSLSSGGIFPPAAYMSDRSLSAPPISSERSDAVGGVAGAAVRGRCLGHHGPVDVLQRSPVGEGGAGPLGAVALRHLPLDPEAAAGGLGPGEEALEDDPRLDLLLRTEVDHLAPGS